jgi:hypothetical protein
MLYDDAPGFDSQHGTANGLSDVWPGSVSFATGSVPAAAKADSPAGLDALTPVSVRFCLYWLKVCQ